MHHLRTGLHAGHFVSLSRSALAAVAVGLPMLAQAQFSGISQNGSATIIYKEYVSFAGGQYTNNYTYTENLLDLPVGSQLVSPVSANSPAQASLSTLVSTDEIRADLNVKATTGFRVIYNFENKPDQNIASDGTGGASATIQFTVANGTAITVGGNNFFGHLDQLNDAGQVTRSFVNTALYDLNWLDSGIYALSIRGSETSIRGQYGMGVLIPGGSTSSGISLKVSAVPEPSTLALWALGGVLLTAATRRRRH
jgi:hypothetical protein